MLQYSHYLMSPAVGNKTAAMHTLKRLLHISEMTPYYVILVYPFRSPGSYLPVTSYSMIYTSRYVVIHPDHCKISKHCSGFVAHCTITTKGIVQLFCNHVWKLHGLPENVLLYLTVAHN